MRPIRSLRANEPHHDVTYDKECDVTEEPHFSYRSCSQCSLLLDGLGAGVFLLGTLTIYNITLTTLKRTQVKFRRKMSSYSFPTTCVTKTKRVEHRALQTFFYDHHCKKGTILTKQLRYRKNIVGLMILF